MMPINNISSSSHIAQTILNQPNLPSEDLFHAAQFVYLLHVHSVIMESWDKFADTREEMAQNNTDAHRSSQIDKGQEEASRLEAHRRKVAAVTKRQSDKYRIYEGTHIAHMHLNAPV